ncbi:penicillin acylase family protein [Actomonas aquatica]|uniref:Penicillin acylase family protein n=1 Tax=Actomonas aquatica TaxID=2866162 RepID=A0ABZ1C4Z2_9BACT|nr:penicillin acylase family protein [Opitutus sp. WL0086]WRQ85584.1 penicillin acylase family protein [Opitutus sp. WL0086]
MKRSFTRRLLRWIGIGLCTVFLVLLAGFAWIWTRVQSSLPTLDGELPLPGLSAPVSLARDAHGVAIIEATSFVDAQRALGFAHGQDRFFQMDLLRRRAAGRLSGLFGAKALPLDRATVVHRFPALAEQVLAAETPERRALLEAYAEGVNAGLHSLADVPWEYAVLRTDPEPWTPIDTVLVSYSLALDLQDSTGTYEKTLTTLRDTLGTNIVDFLNPLIGPDDSALDGTTAPLTITPTSKLINLRDEALPGTTTETDDTAFADPPAVGSNGFVLPGDRTASGSALLAGDPHLGLSLPNVWYRTQLTWPDATGTTRTAVGVSLPGTPGIIIGTNGDIAWTFTNAYIDAGDLVPVDLNSIAPELLYHYKGDSIEFDEHTDEIVLKNGDVETVESTWTVYGPLIGKTTRQKDLAYKWVFHDPSAINFNVLDLNHARSVDEALTIAADVGLPHLNLILADRAGAAAWTVVGRIPQRDGYDGRFPATWTYGDRSWTGWLPADQRPVVRAAPGQALWSGNQRQVGGDALAVLGDSGYDDPDRAAQIERDLAQLTAPAEPADLLAIQLDHRAEWALRWRDLLVQSFAAAGPAAIADADRATFLRLITEWDGMASADSVGYRLIRDWRSQIVHLTLRPMLGRTYRYAPGFPYWRLRYEAGLWALHRDEPMHLLAADYSDWNALRFAAVDRVIANLDEEGTPLETATWGEANALELNHPFGDFLPNPVASWVNLPVTPQAGDSRMPGVARPRFGASLRFVVAPGHEDEALLHLPGGQSGNPLSPYYRAGHDDWLRGRPSPLLAGDQEHTLTLIP